MSTLPGESEDGFGGRGSNCTVEERVTLMASLLQERQAPLLDQSVVSEMVK